MILAERQAVWQRVLVLVLELQNGRTLFGQRLVQPVNLLHKEIQRLPGDTGAHRHIFLQDQRHDLIGDGCGHRRGLGGKGHVDQHR